MDTEKVEGADDSATETTAAAETNGLDLGGLRQQISAEQPATTEAAPATTDEKDEWLNPPSSLKPEYKSDWGKLDKRWRSEFYRRENDFHKGIEPYKGAHQRWEKWDKEVLSPYMARIKSTGAAPEQFISEYLQLDHVLAYGSPQQKQQAVAAFAKYHNIDLAQFAQGTQQQVDPTVAALQQELAELRGTLTQGHTAAREREQQEVLGKIESFKSDPKNIYFADVQDQMARLLQAGLAKDMGDAYEQACKLHPVVSQAIAEQRRKDEEKKRTDEAKAKLANAQRAGFEVQSQGAAQPGARASTLREDLAKQLGIPAY